MERKIKNNDKKRKTIIIKIVIVLMLIIFTIGAFNIYHQIQKNKEFIKNKNDNRSLFDICIGEKMASCFISNYQLDKYIIHHNGTIKAPRKINNLNDQLFAWGYKISAEYSDKYQYLYASNRDDLETNHLIKIICGKEEISLDGYCKSLDSTYYILDYDSIKYKTYKSALQKAINDGYVEIDEAYSLDANDDSFRYSGSFDAVNNYVCLDGVTENGECQDYGNLYRIIGFFKNGEQYEIKLIKASMAYEEVLGTVEKGDYKMWKENSLNIMNLNNMYYNYLINKVNGLANYITTHTWEVGGFDFDFRFDSDFKTIYEKELGKNKLTIESNNCYDGDIYSDKGRECNQIGDLSYNAKIGLMYVSDYLYAMTPDSWKKTINNYYSSNPEKLDNWLFTYGNGIKEQTISRESYSDKWFITEEGHVDAGTSYDEWVRPCFYLSSTTKFAGGSGTEENPYRLQLN